jgi:radical SAM/Cys-rich protein
MTPSEPPATPRRHDFERAVLAAQPTAAQPERIDTLMLNVGLRCDLACAHCHHACSPARTEVMTRGTMLDALQLAAILSPRMLDITGGEPELFEHLRELVSLARQADLETRVRTNLVALARPDTVGLPAFFAEQGVSLLASLPGVSAAQTAEQRGGGRVWETSLEVLRVLGELGYGAGDGLVLDIAYNPPLGQLPGQQREIENEFREALAGVGVRFDSLLALPNVPIGRYRQRLRADGSYAEYLSLLTDAFNPAVTAALECRHGIEIAWDGTLWDCDFNLGAGVRPAGGPLTLAEVLADPGTLASRRIGFGPHCFACTAGTGFG